MTLFAVVQKSARVRPRVALCLCILGLLSLLLTRYSYRQVPLPIPLQSSLSSCSCVRIIATRPSPSTSTACPSTSSSKEAIPNIVHYVWISRDTDLLSFTFLHFLSVYSTYTYLQPNTIYLHTDASESALRIASGPDAANIWTRLILSLPSIKIQSITAPSFPPGQPDRAIGNIEHQSDFVRVEPLSKYGGIYFDFDVFPLRSFKPVLASQANTVLGWQASSEVNNGIIISRNDSKFLEKYSKRMPEAFDGQWTSHGNALLEQLVREEMSHGRVDEVEVLPYWNLHPTSGGESREELMQIHTNCTYGFPINGWNEVHKNDVWKQGVLREDWERDWTDSYTIHAFEIEDWTGGKVDVRYVLERRSQFARALWPTLLKAFEEGLLDISDEGIR